MIKYLYFLCKFNCKLKMNVNIPSRQNIFREMRDYLMIALGMIMDGIGWTVFLLPNDITTGGVPRIASLVYFATGLPVQYGLFRHQLSAIIACHPHFRMEIQHQDNLCRLYPDVLSSRHPATDGRRSVIARPAFHGLRHRRILLRRRYRHCFLLKRKHGRNGYYRRYHQ